MVLAVFDKAASALLTSQLRKLGCGCRTVASADECEEYLRGHLPDLLIVQLGDEAVSVESVSEYASILPVIAVATADPELFFRAAKAGAEVVLSLPLGDADPQKLADICSRLHGLPGVTPHEQTQPVHSSKTLHTHIPSLFATSDEMSEVRDLIAKVAPTSATVLIKGESGVGKELAARLIHSSSPRSERAFIKVNCAAIPNELLESELFGYEQGAFTGALKGKPGKFELADHGTIFLDEIGEMHPMLQAKLLHVLQDGDFARLGSKRDVSVDARVICATNQALDKLVAAGRFREDLFYRIHVVSITIPPLRERKREISTLLDHFVRRYAFAYGKPAIPFPEDVLDFLNEYDWPGNIRELENLCKRYVIVGGTEHIVAEMAQQKHQRKALTSASDNFVVAPSVEGVEPGALETETIAADASVNAPVGETSLLEIGRRAAWAAERAAIQSMLVETKWNRREAARRLQVSYKALLNKIQVLETESKNSEV